MKMLLCPCGDIHVPKKGEPWPQVHCDKWSVNHLNSVVFGYLSNEQAKKAGVKSNTVAISGPGRIIAVDDVEWQSLLDNDPAAFKHIVTNLIAIDRASSTVLDLDVDS